MYTPKAFEVTDLPLLHAAMKQSELATLVTTTTHGLVATHLPLLLDETRGEYGTLTGHVSRANLQWRETDPEAEALIIFLGPIPMFLLTGIRPSRKRAEWCRPGTTPPFMPMAA